MTEQRRLTATEIADAFSVSPPAHDCRPSMDLVLETLGCPKHTISLDLSIKANNVATARVTFHPEDSNGRPLTGSSEHGGVLQTIAEDCVLIPRALYDDMPDALKALVRAYWRATR